MTGWKLEERPPAPVMEFDPMNMQAYDARRNLSGSYRVDASRGERIGRVSSEWFNRPDDERFLSLDILADMVRGRAETSRTRVLESGLIRVEASRDDPERLSLMLPGADAPVAPTNWSFGQLARLVGAPAAYLRQIPAALASPHRSRPRSRQSFAKRARSCSATSTRTRCFRPGRQCWTIARSQSGARWSGFMCFISTRRTGSSRMSAWQPGPSIMFRSIQEKS